jgi:hypothetical protein
MSEPGFGGINWINGKMEEFNYWNSGIAFEEIRI